MGNVERCVGVVEQRVSELNAGWDVEMLNIVASLMMEGLIAGIFFSVRFSQSELSIQNQNSQ